jgi:hypothetical protein
MAMTLQIMDFSVAYSGTLQNQDVTMEASEATTTYE